MPPPVAQLDATLAPSPLAVGLPPKPRRKRWTFDEYAAITDERSRLHGRRVELLNGEIIERAAQLDPHEQSIYKIGRYLFRAFDEPFVIILQGTHKIDEANAPEPDFCVLPKAPPKEGYEKPDPPVLVVEVSHTTLAHDRRKAVLYALARAEEYWLVNLIDRVIEVHRDPRPDPTSRTGLRFAMRTVAQAGETLAPLARPGCLVEVERWMP